MQESPLEMKELDSVSEIAQISDSNETKGKAVCEVLTSKDMGDVSAEEQNRSKVTTKRMVGVIPECLPNPLHSCATQAAYKAYLEEQDRLYAKRLNKEYEMEEKLRLTIFHFKESKGAYSFRRKKSTVSKNEKTTATVKRSHRCWYLKV